MRKVTVEVPDDLLKQWVSARPPAVLARERWNQTLGRLLRTSMRKDILKWAEMEEARYVAMKALAAGVQDTVTDNGDGTYTHALRRKDQPAKSSDK